MTSHSHVSADLATGTADAPHPRLMGATVPVGALSPHDRDVAYGLLAAYYAGTNRAQFDRDLDAKSVVVVLRDADSLELKGFCTVHLQTLRIAGKRRKVTVLFTGDTVVDKEYWGQKVLHTQMSRLMLRTKLRHPFRPLYWLLISKGYKTYMIVVRTSRNMAPRFDRPTSPRIATFMHELATQRFGDRYDAQAGVVRGKGDTDFVREGISPITPELLERDAHIAYFQERNPGHVHGDELVCLAPMVYSDMISTLVAARRVRSSKRRGTSAS